MGKQGKQWQTIFLGSKITADGDCSHEIKRRLLLGRKAMTKPRQHSKRPRLSDWTTTTTKMLNIFSCLLVTYMSSLMKRLFRFFATFTIGYLSIVEFVRNVWFSFFFFLLCHVACRISVLWPGIKPAHPALEVQSLQIFSSSHFPDGLF